MRHLILIMVVVLAACGSDSDDSATAIGDVTGTYSFITSSFTYTCTDGSNGVSDSTALQFNIVQSGQTVTMAQTSSSVGSGGVAGITVLESTDPAGIVESNGSFVMTSSIVASIDGFPGENTITYRTAGAFTSVGWSGTYSYDVFFQDLFETCSYTSTFRGTKA